MTEWQRNRMQHTTGIRPVRDSRHSAQTFTNCTTACMYCWRYTRLIAEPFTCILMLYIYMLYYLIRSWPAACICTLFHKPEFWSVQSTNAMCINNIQVLLCSMELKRHEVEPCTAFEVGHKCLHFYTYMQWFRCVESTLCAFISINIYAPNSYMERYPCCERADFSYLLSKATGRHVKCTYDAMYLLFTIYVWVCYIIFVWGNNVIMNIDWRFLIFILAAIV